MMFVPESLTAIREASGRTKSKVAVGAQITLSYLSELEAGNRIRPSDAVVAQLADALDCEPEAFFVRRKWLRQFVRSNPGLVLEWIRGAGDADEEAA